MNITVAGVDPVERTENAPENKSSKIFPIFLDFPYSCLSKPVLFMEYRSQRHIIRL